jgi:porin
MRATTIVGTLVTLLTAVSSLAAVACADEAPASAAGARARLAARGIELAATLTADGVRVARGGVERRAATLATLDAQLDLDLATLAGWPGARAHVGAIAHRGASPSAFAGDAQALDNLDLPDALRAGEAWLELGGARGSLRAGLYDLNTEFDTGEVSALFLNSSHGLGPDLAQCGERGPAVYPNTALGARAIWTAAPALTVRAALTDGAPGDPAHPGHVDLRWRAGDGATVVTELERASGAGGWTGGRVVLGAWHTTGAFHDVRDLDAAGAFPLRGGDAGAYGRLERAITRERRDDAQGLSGWVRAGWARPSVNVFDRYTGGGLVYTGALPGRAADALGVAVAVAHVGSGYFRERVANGLASDWNEVAIELTYRAELAPWLAVQPDAQYIQHPGLDPEVADAITLGARVELDF